MADRFYLIVARSLKPVAWEDD